MKKSDLTRSYLETLSSTDLIALGDDYGIDIQENLTRRFVITEILDSIEGQEDLSPKAQQTVNAPEVLDMAFTYNENKITAVLRNPAWCYVTWDFNKEKLSEISESDSFEGFIVRIHYCKTKSTTDSSETFDVQIISNINEQFILLSPEYPAFYVSLEARFDDKQNEILAISNTVVKQVLSVDINLSGLQKAFTPIQELSGLPAVLKSHYNEHRHSFVRV